MYNSPNEMNAVGCPVLVAMVSSWSMAIPYAPLRVVPVLFAAVVFAKSNTAWIGVLSLTTSAPVLCLDTALIATASLIVKPFTSPMTSQSIPILSFEEPVSTLFEMSIVIPLTSVVPEVLVSLIVMNEFPNSN